MMRLCNDLEIGSTYATKKGEDRLEKHLYDIQGYTVKIEVTKTYNPSRLGLSVDSRDLGGLLCYLGAAKPEYDSMIYEEDPYVISRLQFPFEGRWNDQAIRGFYGPEENGTWMGAKNIVFLKDSGIRSSGLKIVYYVPEILSGIGAEMKVFVEDELVYRIPLDQEGMFTEILDVSHVGKAQREYLEKAHRILKILLREFDRVCQKYDLRYYLICGSLLGAVRHKDLIPWDDDVDVAMPREDFDRLLKCAAKEWGEKDDFLFLNYDEMGNHAFLDYMTRLVYMKEEIPVNIFRKIKGKGRKDIDGHLPMDIYVLDNASDNEKLHKIQTQTIRGLYGLAMGHRAYIDPQDYANRDEQTQKIVKALSSAGKRSPLPWILGAYEWVRKWNRKKRTRDYFESNGFIYCIPWRFRQVWFGEGKRLPLGRDLTVSVPNNYEAFLRMHYEDYMQYPPMEARKPTHSIEASGIF